MWIYCSVYLVLKFLLSISCEFTAQCISSWKARGKEGELVASMVSLCKVDRWSFDRAIVSTFPVYSGAASISLAPNPFIVDNRLLHLLKIIQSLWFIKLINMLFPKVSTWYILTHKLRLILLNKKLFILGFDRQSSKLWVNKWPKNLITHDMEICPCSKIAKFGDCLPQCLNTIFILPKYLSRILLLWLGTILRDRIQYRKIGYNVWKYRFG